MIIVVLILSFCDSKYHKGKYVCKGSVGKAFGGRIVWEKRTAFRNGSECAKDGYTGELLELAWRTLNAS